MNNVLLILWGILNIAAFGYLVYLVLKAAKRIRERNGKLVSAIFVFVVFSVAVSLNAEKAKSKPAQQWHFSQADRSGKLYTSILRIKLDDNQVAIHQLNIFYKVNEKLNTNTPVSTWSFQTGFVSGKEWKPASITVQPTADKNKLAYTVDGIDDWKLLGITLFSETRHYSGIAQLSPADRI